MKAAAFRLGFVAACSGYVLGLVLVAGWLSAWVGVVVGGVGVAVAVLLAEETPELPSVPSPRVLAARWAFRRRRHGPAAVAGEEA